MRTAWVSEKSGCPEGRRGTGPGSNGGGGSATSNKTGFHLVFSLLIAEQKNLSELGKNLRLIYPHLFIYW